MTRPELAVQALKDRGYKVARTTSQRGTAAILVRFVTPAVAFNAAEFLQRLGVDARVRGTSGQWALQVR